MECEAEEVDILDALNLFLVDTGSQDEEQGKQININ